MSFVRFAEDDLRRTPPLGRGCIALFVLVLALSGFAALFAAAGAFDTFREQAISKAEEAVKSQLKDPSSAIFEDVFVVYGPRVPNMPMPTREMYTCGYVNSRNSFGAMAGKTRFVVRQDATKFNKEMLSSTYEATLEDPTTDFAAGDQSSFDMVHWSKCRGEPVPEHG